MTADPNPSPAPAPPPRTPLITVVLWCAKLIAAAFLGYASYLKMTSAPIEIEMRKVEIKLTGQNQKWRRGGKIDPGGGNLSIEALQPPGSGAPESDLSTQVMAGAPGFEAPCRCRRNQAVDAVQRPTDLTEIQSIDKYAAAASIQQRSFD